MFERYTEQARRVIFFARYEVSVRGGHEIGTEHLLLGLLREYRGLLRKLLKPPSSPEKIRDQICEAIPIGEKVATSVDLPLNVECKLILALAAEEADHLRHPHIGAEHLLLGILRQENCRAAAVLRENGLTPHEVRETSPHRPQETSPDHAYFHTLPEEVLRNLGPYPIAVAQQTRQDIAVQVEGLTKTYPGVTEPLQILQGIDLTIYKGEIIAIVGQSGSGKSTLLHILGTIDRPTSGSVRFGDQNPFELNAEELAKFRRRSIGFVFQFHNLLPEFTALENVMMPKLIAGHRSDERMGVELLELVGLGNRLKHRPGELSGGEQQRVAIARALVNNPLLILADEPTGALDNQTGELVFQLFQKIQREKNLTSILATHNASIANRCNRLFRLENSRLHESSQHYV
jgi:lipoprotein-releasing system ATP-binding protein